MSETGTTPPDNSTPPPPAPPSDGSQLVNIEDEMRGAYLDYAMSVIIGRALPDVRDGLKPVHRRALYAMYDLGNSHDKPYKKSARVVGDVIGKYHPHGDTAVYDSIVRMAQDFSLRYPLVDGQGNFGSVDGDSPAAMRYTEVRMAKITSELLNDIDKDTVDFGRNYDESLEEPLVFPAKFPNLLVNGSAGIAVGMATNIPPHNLTEVINASVELIKNPELSIDELISHVKGPDFPTAGIIVGTKGIESAYKKGKGVIKIRAKATIEPHKARERIIVSELPYQVNKARLIEKIADLVRNRKISGISDLRDESDRQGMRIVIEIKKGENSNVILNQLYKLTQMQESFGITLIAIHHNQPKLFNLKDFLWAFVEHRKEVVLRRTAYDLRKAEAKAHILEGLKRAVENLDPIIKLIRGAKGPTEAKAGLIEQFQFSDKQAQAILDMRLQRLTGLEREKIAKDYKDVMALIEELKSILASEAKVFEIICNELEEVRNSYGDDRRTEIVKEEAETFEVEDLIADEDVLVTITHKGYIKRTDPRQFRTQQRGGKGVKAASTSEEDFVSSIYKCTKLSYLLCLTDKGRLYWMKVYKVPEGSRTSKGKAIVNLVAISPNETICDVIPIKEFDDKQYVVLVTKKGMIKKCALSEFKNFRTKGMPAITIKDGDELLAARISDGNKEIFLCSKAGKSVRFPEDQVRKSGRSSQGVTGMAIKGDNSVVALEVLDKDTGDTDSEIFLVTSKGYGKRSLVKDYRLSSRGIQGVMAMKLTDRTGHVVAACQIVGGGTQAMLVSSKGKMIKISLDEISGKGRVTQGVRVMTTESGEEVVAMEKVAEGDK